MLLHAYNECPCSFSRSLALCYQQVKLTKCLESDFISFTNSKVLCNICPSVWLNNHQPEFQGGGVGTAVQISSFYDNAGKQSKTMSGRKLINSKTAKRRGRPKGATSASISEVRKQAAEEQRRLKWEYTQLIEGLKTELEQWKQRYEDETTRLNAELDLLRKREYSYQQALEARLSELAGHLHETLVNWGKAELEEAQIDKRKRGRPRKTIKLK